VDQEGVSHPAGGDDDVARLVALTERQHDLWALLRDATDDDDRNRLFDELSANRDELAKLKERVSAEVDSQRAVNPASPPQTDPPRSVGEELRARILTPDQVAPASPPPPPPPTVTPPVVPEPVHDEVADREVLPAVEATHDGESPPPEADESGPVEVHEQPRQSTGQLEPSRQSEDLERPSPILGGLAPETTPFSSREADLAAMRARRESSPSEPTPREPEPQRAAPPDTERTTDRRQPDETPEASVRTSEEEDRLASAHARFQDLERVRPKHSRSFPVFAVLIAVLAVAAVVWMLFFWPDDTTGSTQPAVTTTTVEAAAAASPVGQVRAVLDGLGFANVAVEERSGTIFLVGIVGSEEGRAAIIGATAALVGDTPLDASGITIATSDDDVRLVALQAIGDAGYDKINVTVAAGVATLSGVTPEGGASGLVAVVEEVPGIDQVVDMTEASDRADALDSELQRITSVTPLIFASGQTELNALQERILDSAAEAIEAYPGPVVTVVGYTDSAGSEEGNIEVSLIRANNVTDYLVGQGIDSERLLVEARGESASSGSSEVAGLERRVEFEVGYSVTVGADAALRIGIVAPSARDDLAFTQSIVDAANVIADERSGVDIDITDNTFVTEEAAAAIRDYAAEGYDLVLAHGSQYGTSLVDIAAEFPGTAFAWGTAAETFGLPNVSSYAVASDEGGYVMGVVAALLTESDVIGVVVPLEVGDAQLFVDGFRNGVLTTNPDASVPVTYTGSFSDVALAAEAATAHLAEGADVLTGTAQMVVGAVGVAAENDALWFGAQSNQVPLAPDLVVASQVYHWEVVLRQIISGIDSGNLGGEIYTIDLANGGIIVEYNEAFELPDTVRDAADDTIAAIITGNIITGV
jgi:basic membrane protein A